MLSPTELTNYLESKDKNLQAKQELLDSITREVKSVRTEMDKVYALYMTDQITAEGFGERYKPMEIQLAQLQEQLPKLQAAVDFLKVGILSRNQILTEAQNLATFWPDMTREAKRQVVESLVEKIIIGQDDIEINLCYLPSVHHLSTDEDEDLTESEDDNTPTGSEPPKINSRNVIACAFAKNMAKRPTAVAG